MRGAASHLSNVDCEMAKENVRRLSSQCDAMMEWGGRCPPCRSTCTVWADGRVKRTSTGRPSDKRCGSGIHRSDCAISNARGDSSFRGKAPARPRVRGPPTKTATHGGEIMDKLWMGVRGGVIFLMSTASIGTEATLTRTPSMLTARNFPIWLYPEIKV